MTRKSHASIMGSLTLAGAHILQRPSLVRSALARTLSIHAAIDQDDDDDFYGYGFDVDGPLLSSDRDVIYFMPVAFGALCLFFLAIQQLLPFLSNGKPIGFAIVTLIAFVAGGTFDNFNLGSDRDDEEFMDFD